MEFDVEKDLSIDKYQLDKECLTHPSIFYRYLQAASEADNIVTEKKDLLKVTLAKTEIRLREQFTNDGKKVTEGIVSSAVSADAEVIDVQNQLREAQETSIKLNAAIKAFDSRKSSLDNLVKLYCAGYFATTSKGSETYDRTEMIANAVRNGIGGTK